MMNKIFAIIIFLVVIHTDNALAMVCKSTHSKNYEVNFYLDDLGNGRATLKRLKPQASIEFNESDLQSARTHDRVTYYNYATKQLAANLSAQLDITFLSDRPTHIFLTLKNNLTAWNEPLKCK